MLWSSVAFVVIAARNFTLQVMCNWMTLCSFKLQLYLLSPFDKITLKFQSLFERFMSEHVEKQNLKICACFQVNKKSCVEKKSNVYEASQCIVDVISLLYKLHIKIWESINILKS